MGGEISIFFAPSFPVQCAHPKMRPRCACQKFLLFVKATAKYYRPSSFEMLRSPNTSLSLARLRCLTMEDGWARWRQRLVERVYLHIDKWNVLFVHRSSIFLQLACARLLKHTVRWTLKITNSGESHAALLTDLDRGHDIFNHVTSWILI